MTRNIIFTILILASTIYASQPGPLVTVDFNVNSSSGAKGPIDISVIASINPEYIAMDLEDAEFNIEAYLPPALNLLGGQQEWAGKLTTHSDTVLQLRVASVLDYSAVYDIGVSVTSDAIEEEAILASNSFFLGLESNIVLSETLHDKLTHVPELQNVLGYVETNSTNIEGQTRLIRGIRAGDNDMNVLKLHEHLDSLQSVKPYKLYNRDWINHIRSLADNRTPDEESIRLYNLREEIFIKEDFTNEEVYDFIEQHRRYKESISSIDLTKGKIKDNSDTRLSDVVSHIMIYGDVSSVSANGAVENAYCYLQKEGPGGYQTLDTYYTDYSTGSYYFHIYNYDIEADYRVVIKLKNINGDSLTEDSSTEYVPGPEYLMIDESWEIVSGWILDFGNVDFYDDGDAQYGDAASLFNYLSAASSKTHLQGGINPSPVRVDYPSRHIGGGEYSISREVIQLSSSSNHNTIRHEYGHHVYYEAYGSDINYGSYSKSCNASSNASTAFVEGWAEFCIHWFAGSMSDDNPCYPNVYGDLALLNNEYGLWDIIDSNVDTNYFPGETCDLSMYQLIDALQHTTYGVYDWTSLVTRLKSMYTQSAADIDSVCVLNGLPNGTLLANVASNTALPSIQESTELFGNSPNPFNPSTTISYTVGGAVSQDVSLDIYNIRGQIVKQLVSDAREPGKYVVFWDGKDYAGKHVSSGVYFYKLSAGDFHAVRKMIILK